MGFLDKMKNNLEKEISRQTGQVARKNPDQFRDAISDMADGALLQRWQMDVHHSNTSSPQRRMLESEISNRSSLSWDAPTIFRSPRMTDSDLVEAFKRAESMQLRSVLKKEINFRGLDLDDFVDDSNQVEQYVDYNGDVSGDEDEDYAEMDEDQIQDDDDDFSYDDDSDDFEESNSNWEVETPIDEDVIKQYLINRIADKTKSLQSVGGHVEQLISILGESNYVTMVVLSELVDNVITSEFDFINDKKELTREEKLLIQTAFMAGIFDLTNADNRMNESEPGALNVLAEMTGNKFKGSLQVGENVREVSKYLEAIQLLSSMPELKKQVLES